MNERPLLPSGRTIFCDDIRDETWGKYSLMGIYDGQMSVLTGIPVTLPKFCFLIHYVEPMEIAKARKGDMEIQIYFPWDDANSPAIVYPVPFESTVKNLPRQQLDDDITPVFVVKLPVMLAGFEIKQPGLIRVRATLDGEIIKLGALEIIDQRVPSAENML
jgi:hypothetical protein